MSIKRIENLLKAMVKYGSSETQRKMIADKILEELTKAKED